MGRRQSEAGPISTQLHRVPRRWGRGRDGIPWTTISAIGTGRKSSKWVGRIYFLLTKYSH